MYEYRQGAEGDPGDSSFALSDADFSPASIELRRALGRKDMHHALRFPELVDGIGGDRAALYRYGTYGKHLVTDREIAARFARTAPEPKRAPANAATETGHVIATEAAGDTLAPEAEAPPAPAR
jgi:hypothetical protein